jgi:spore maturation protein CgeB
VETFNALVVNSKLNNPNYYICKSIINALKRSELIENVIEVNYSDSLKNIQNLKFDFFLVLDGAQSDNEFIANICSFSKFSIIWNFDDPYDLSRSLNVQDLFNLNLSTSESSISLYKKAYYLPLAGDPDIFLKPPRKKPKFEMSFVGTAWPNRIEFLGNLPEDLINKSFVKLMPIQSSNFDNSKIPNRFLSTSYFSPDILADIYNNSLVTLSLPREYSEDALSISKNESPAPRIYEQILSGSLVIGDNKVELPVLNSSNLNFPSFENEKVEQVLNYLNSNVERRLVVIKKLQNEVLQNHTYDTRVKQILQLFQNEKSEKVDNHIPLKKDKILHVTNNFYFPTGENKSFGGSDIWLKQFINKIDISSKFDQYILCPNTSKSSYVLYDINGLEIETGPGYRYYPWMISEKTVEEWFTKLVFKHNFKLINFNHIIDLPPSLIYIACQLTRVSLVFHDYFYFCPTITLTSHENKYCGILDEVEPNCDLCLDKIYNYPNGTFKNRKQIFSYLIQYSDISIFPSRFSYSKLSSKFAALSSKVNSYIIPPVANVDARVTGPATQFSDKRIRLIFIGNLTLHKGEEILKSLIQLLDFEKFDFIIYGKVSDEFKIEMQSLPITIHEDFNSQENLNIISGDFAIFPTLWHETFHLALEECYKLGIHVITSTLGAAYDRHKDNPNFTFIKAIDEVKILQQIYLRIENSALISSGHKQNDNYEISQIEDFIINELQSRKSPKLKFYGTSTKILSDNFEKLTIKRHFLS